MRDWCRARQPPPISVAGVVGRTGQALAEAELAASIGYDAVLLSLAAMRDADNAALLDHCRRVADIIPVVGFYLQPAVGAVPSIAISGAAFDIDRVVAIKVAPFDRYRTLDVTAALAESGRDDVALYTGNDDAIVADLLTPFSPTAGRDAPRWPSRPVGRRHAGRSLFIAATPSSVTSSIRAMRDETLRLLALGAELTDLNAALFDPANGFAGCIAGIHEVLRRQCSPAAGA